MCCLATRSGSDISIRPRTGSAHLANYLERLVTGMYDSKMVSYLDFVGKIHTPRAGSKELNVPLVQMDALTGFVFDALLGALLELPLEHITKTQTIRAFNKLSGSKTT